MGSVGGVGGVGRWGDGEVGRWEVWGVWGVWEVWGGGGEMTNISCPLLQACVYFILGNLGKFTLAVATKGVGVVNSLTG